MLKETLGMIAVVMTFSAFLPYIHSIKLGKTKPHVFSWVIWALTTFIVFLAQILDGGGAGAWAIGVSGLITMYVAILAYNKKGDIHMTQVDRLFFIAALCSMVLWYFTSSPLWTVIILTLIDGFGFAPTFRKSYERPFDEPLIFYVILTLRNIVAIAALMHYSIITVLFPAVTGFLGLVFIVMVFIRRKQLTH